jgi:hypothetical protein
VTVCVYQYGDPGAQRRTLRYRRQAVEELAGHHSVPVPRGEVPGYGDQRSPADEPAVVKRFSQRVLGLTRRRPVVQPRGSGGCRLCRWRGTLPGAVRELRLRDR